VAVELAQSEDVIVQWFKTLTFTGTPHIFLDIDEIRPPVLLIRRVGGGPAFGGVPADLVRVVVDVWANNRPHASTLSAELVSAVEDLTWQGDIRLASGIMKTGEVLNVLWLPDVVGKTPRYVHDLRFTVVKG
jgi:hypothetical protein